MLLPYLDCFRETSFFLREKPVLIILGYLGLKISFSNLNLSSDNLYIAQIQPAGPMWNPPNIYLTYILLQ